MFHIAAPLSLAAGHRGCCNHELITPGSEICFCLPSRGEDQSPKLKWSGPPHSCYVASVYGGKNVKVSHRSKFFPGLNYSSYFRHPSWLIFASPTGQLLFRYIAPCAKALPYGQSVLHLTETSLRKTAIRALYKSKLASLPFPGVFAVWSFYCQLWSSASIKETAEDFRIFWKRAPMGRIL